MNKIFFGDCIQSLQALPEKFIHTCVTSPPYFGLRSYLPEGHQDKNQELGLEQTPDEYVAKLVAVFREVRRVLRDDGTLWLNLGDSYNSGTQMNSQKIVGRYGEGDRAAKEWAGHKPLLSGLKPKDLIGIPWAVATALRDPYYTGQITKERDRSWIAAMVDGEGTICGFHHIRGDNGSPRTGVHITITNSNIPLLDEANRIWPTSRSEHGRPGPGHLGNRATFRWIVHGADNKMMFLREVYPYLIAKKRQAIVAYNLLLMMPDAKKNGHSAQRDAFREKRKSLTDIISDLNQGRTVDLPSWLVEPPSVFEPGYYLRQDIVWAKKNCMPESVTDRCTKSHEYIFLLSKSERYYFDNEAIKEPTVTRDKSVRNRDETRLNNTPGRTKMGGLVNNNYETRNRRSVWNVSTKPYKGAHFATFPPDLITPCVLAGAPPEGIVLDPFMGSGTTAMVAVTHGRQYVGCELNPEYGPLQEERIYKLFADMI